MSAYNKQRNTAQSGKGMQTSKTGKDATDVLLNACKIPVSQQRKEIAQSRLMKTSLVAPVSLDQLNTPYIKQLLEKCTSYTLKYSPYTKKGGEMMGCLELTFQECKDVVEAEKSLKKWKPGVKVYSCAQGDGVGSVYTEMTGDITEAQRAERTIVVENLPTSATEKQILQLYSGHTAMIACDESGMPLGRAYVECLLAETAMEAVMFYNNKVLDKKKLVCCPMVRPSGAIIKALKEKSVPSATQPKAKTAGSSPVKPKTSAVDALIDLRRSLAEEWDGKDLKKLADLLKEMEGCEKVLEMEEVPDWKATVNKGLQISFKEKSQRDIAMLSLGALRSRITLLQKRIGLTPPPKVDSVTAKSPTKTPAKTPAKSPAPSIPSKPSILKTTSPTKSFTSPSTKSFTPPSTKSFTSPSTKSFTPPNKATTPTNQRSGFSGNSAAVRGANRMPEASHTMQASRPLMSSSGYKPSYQQSPLVGQSKPQVPSLLEDNTQRSMPRGPPVRAAPRNEPSPRQQAKPQSLLSNPMQGNGQHTRFSPQRDSWEGARQEAWGSSQSNKSIQSNNYNYNRHDSEREHFSEQGEDSYYSGYQSSRSGGLSGSQPSAMKRSYNDDSWSAGEPVTKSLMSDSYMQRSAMTNNWDNQDEDSYRSTNASYKSGGNSSYMSGKSSYQSGAGPQSLMSRRAMSVEQEDQDSYWGQESPSTRQSSQRQPPSRQQPSYESSQRQLSSRQQQSYENPYEREEQRSQEYW